MLTHLIGWLRFPSPIKKIWPWIYLILVSLVIELAFYGWVYDDPFITYRYAHNLATGNGFTYNPGQPALSVTSPLFTLLLAAGAVIGIKPHRLAILLGSISIAVGGLLLWELSKKLKSSITGWIGLLFYPAFALLLTTLGSETPLYLTLCLGAFTSYIAKKPYQAAALSALACLTRPDGILVPIALLFHAWINRLQLDKRAFLVFSIIIAPWLIYAWQTFGSPIPLTLFAKQAQGSMFISKNFLNGLIKLIKNNQKGWQWLFKYTLAFLGFFQLSRQWKSWAFMIAWSILYILGFSLLGVSAYFWYYAPLIPIFLLFIGLGLESLFTKLSNFPIRIRDYTLVIAATLVGVIFFTDLNNMFTLSQQQDDRFKIYQAAGLWLKKNTPKEALTAALEIGVLGYYAQRPMIDFAGLLQPSVAQHLIGAHDYETGALFTVEKYHPDYLVLHQGLYPNLENKLTTMGCKQVHRIKGGKFDYQNNMNIIQCNLP